MTQAPEKGEEPCLPHGLSVVSTYTEMTTGNKHVTVVIKNQTTGPITIDKGVKITWVVAASRVPPVEVMPRILEKLDELQGVWQAKISIQWKKEMLLEQLDLSGLEGQSRANHTSAHALLTEYNDINLLEPGELGCTSLAKHEIWVVDDKPLKRDFEGPTSYGGGSEGPHEGNVGSRHYSL